jgi:flavin reductase (DIM6/NTAB) family NADH-FMN oxidoreductase RutF
MSSVNGEPSSDQEAILDTLHWLAMPVVVVAASANAHRSCATGTLSYVSLQPPMIATSLARSSLTYQLAHESGLFSISFLRNTQADIAALTAQHGSTPDKFLELDIAAVEWLGVPALEDCGAVLWCSIVQEHTVGDSVLCVAKVQWSTPGSSGGNPLLRFGGRYHEMGERVDAAGELPYPL